MDDKQTKTVSSAVSVFAGLFLSVLTYSLVLMAVILFFGEMENSTAAIHSSLCVGGLSVLAYAFTELYLYPRVTRKSLLALSYFLGFAVLTALFYRFIGDSPLLGAFRGREEEVRSLLRMIVSCLCAIHAGVLILRILWEIVRYAKISLEP